MRRPIARRPITGLRRGPKRRRLPRETLRRPLSLLYRQGPLGAALPVAIRAADGRDVGLAPRLQLTLSLSFTLSQWHFHRHEPQLPSDRIAAPATADAGAATFPIVPHRAGSPSNQRLVGAPPSSGARLVRTETRLVRSETRLRARPITGGGGREAQAGKAVAAGIAALLPGDEAKSAKLLVHAGRSAPADLTAAAQGRAAPAQDGRLVASRHHPSPALADLAIAGRLPFPASREPLAAANRAEPRSTGFARPAAPAEAGTVAQTRSAPGDTGKPIPPPHRPSPAPADLAIARRPRIQGSSTPLAAAVPAERGATAFARPAQHSRPRRLESLTALARPPRGSSSGPKRPARPNAGAAHAGVSPLYFVGSRGETGKATPRIFAAASPSLDYRDAAQPAPPRRAQPEAQPSIAPGPGVRAIDTERVSQDVMARIEKRLRIERERRGRS